MPYLEIKKNDVEKEDSAVFIEMPDVTGMKLTEAMENLKKLGLEVQIDGKEGEETTVKDQLPKKGIQLSIGTKVTIYVQ